MKFVPLKGSPPIPGIKEGKLMVGSKTHNNKNENTVGLQPQRNKCST